MCAPGCIEHVHGTLTRRGLAGGLAAAAAVLSAPMPASAAPRPRRFPAFSRTIDLTHTFTPEFPTFFNTPGVSLKKIKDFKTDGYNVNEWTVLEHAGTHIDAPLHFSAAGTGVAELPLEQLVVPLVVIDVSAKTKSDADYQLSPADIAAWERRHRRIPRGACVALHSGWAAYVNTPRFAGRDGKSLFHFPGFHPEATQFLMERREVVGIAVDTLSLDHGASKDFKVHTSWLPSGRWGLENVAGLDAVPPAGATLVVGAPKIAGATGGPSRVIALV